MRQRPPKSPIDSPRVRVPFPAGTLQPADHNIWSAGAVFPVRAFVLQRSRSMKRSLYVAAALTGLCLSLAMVTLSLSGCSQLAQAINIQNPTYSLRNFQPHVGIALPLSASTIDF